MSFNKALFLAIVVILIDQISKIYIKTNFLIGEEVQVFEWFKIHFIENDGMAWGVELPGNYGKLILTLFRTTSHYQAKRVFYAVCISNVVKQHKLS